MSGTQLHTRCSVHRPCRLRHEASSPLGTIHASVTGLNACWHEATAPWNVGPSRTRRQLAPRSGAHGDRAQRHSGNPRSVESARLRRTRSHSPALSSRTDNPEEPACDEHSRSSASSLGMKPTCPGPRWGGAIKRADRQACHHTSSSDDSGMPV